MTRWELYFYYGPSLKFDPHYIQTFEMVKEGFEWTRSTVFRTIDGWNAEKTENVPTTCSFNVPNKLAERKKCEIYCEAPEDTLNLIVKLAYIVEAGIWHRFFLVREGCLEQFVEDHEHGYEDWDNQREMFDLTRVYQVQFKDTTVYH